MKENESAGTCVAKGGYDSVVYCSVCGTEISRIKIETDLNPNNHVAVEIGGDATKATCTNDGYTGTVYCTACGEDGEARFIREGDIIPALGGDHVYENGVCTRCGTPEPEAFSPEE